MNKHEIGKQKINSIIGPRSEEIINMLSEVSVEYADYVINFAYGDLYSRNGFNDKFRELAAVACLIGQGNTGVPLKAHLEAMMQVGWTKKEVIELIIFLIVYVGFPATVDAIVTLRQILAEKPELK